MPKTVGYVNNPSKDGTISLHLTKENSLKLDLFCKINNLNKTQFANRIIGEFLDEKFGVLKMDPNDQLYL